MKGCSAPQTLYCGNAVHDQLLQVTRASLRLVDAGTRELRREWRPPAGLSIDVAAASASQVLRMPIFTRQDSASFSRWQDTSRPCTMIGSTPKPESNPCVYDRQRPTRCFDHSQALLASGDGNLTYVEIVEGDIQEKAHLKLDSEIACLDLSPLGARAGIDFHMLQSPTQAGRHAAVTSMVLIWLINPARLE